MNKKHLTHEDIDHWLHNLNLYEALAKTHYEQKGHFLDAREIPEVSFAPVRLHPTDLYNLASPDNNIYPLFLPNVATTFLENDYFLPGYDIYLQKQPQYTNSPMQEHLYYEICYQYDGSSLVSFFTDRQDDMLTLHEGDFLFIPSGQRHAVRIDTGSIMINIGIRESTFQSTFSHNLPDDSILGHFFTHTLQAGSSYISYVLFRTGNEDVIRQSFYRLAILYCTPSLYAKNKINLQLSGLFLELLDNYSDYSHIAASNSLAQRIPAIIHYLEQNYIHANATDVARYFGYSVNNINTILKKITNHTLGEMLLTLKMQKASTLLKNTSLSVAEIAEKLGYSDPTSLIRSYKKYFGITPNQYRKSGRR